jgi:hypothetical protein
MLGGNSAYTPPAFESIATATASGSSVTFSSIPQTYTSLQIRATMRLNDTGLTQVGMRMNGNTGSNYSAHNLWGDGSDPYAGANTSDTRMTFGNIAGGTNQQTVAIWDVHNYTSTTQNKTVRVLMGYDLNDGSGRIWNGSGLFIDTSAVTSITFTLPAGSFVAGSFNLYGIN